MANATGKVPKASRRIPHLRRPLRVGLLLETSTEYGRGVLRGIVRYSRLHGPWSLYVAPGHLEQFLPKDGSWKGDGIIGRVHSRHMAKVIHATGLPFVASSVEQAWPPQSGKKFGEIRTNSAAIARMAATHLADRGLRRFAFCGFKGCGWSERREEAFYGYVRESRFQCEVRRITLGNLLHGQKWIEHWEDEQRSLSDWLKSLIKPVGLMACNDVCGRAVLQVCATSALAVPDQIAVVGVDNDELMCGLSTPSLSSVALDLEKAGYQSAEMLDGLISGRLERGHVVAVEPVYVATRVSSDPVGQEDPCVARALRFIRDHAAQPINVSDVVGSLGISRRTVERRFSSTVGRSILSEITQCRLQRAKRLLIETDLPSYRVAHAVGFGVPKTFNRVFRRTAGISPLSFRQNERG